MLSPSPPHHRTIFAVDIEGSTTRNNSAKADLRGAMYELVEQSLCANGITAEFREPFVDRGDGILALVRPVDEVPKTLLLAGVVPTLTGLLVQHEEQYPDQHLRLRAVLHAGEVHQDIQGCFGEALDVAFRLLDAREVKDAFRLSTAPLVLVVSELIYRSIVLQGYEGIDEQDFTRVVDVPVGRVRYQGWVCLPGLPMVEATPLSRRAMTGPRILRAARRFEERKHVV
ncbi:MAG TPA: hypothetical protein VFX16_08750 [Pseudonocardiaceae bacterium]|nr:hypothetical protein [Pseudonocardiaceae bacterium]